MEWSKNKYNEYYNSYMPWIEDKLLGWWGDNKTSYTAKDKMKTRVTGDENVNKVQDGLADGVGGQFGKGGLLQPVGEGLSKEGANRAERGETGLGKDDTKEGVLADAQKGPAGSVGESVKGGAGQAAGAVQSGLGSVMGGGKEKK